jgi:hypothetical protein
MFTFSIRDLFWLLLLSAVITGWLTHAARHRQGRVAQQTKSEKIENEKYREQVDIRLAEIKELQDERALVRIEVQETQKKTENASRERHEVRKSRSVPAAIK